MNGTVKYYLAIDIGASSGRHIVGWKEDNVVKTEEVYRFDNHVKEENGHLIWDIDSLLKNVKKGIAVARKAFPNINSLAIDTWAVDYVLLKDDQEVLPVYSYRDSRTQSIIDEVHSIIPFSRLYKVTGCQFQPFNTIYQLYWDKVHGRLEGVTDFLMLPEYLLWKLCGNKVHEYTNATSTGLLKAVRKEYDTGIIEKLGLPEQLFPYILNSPGSLAGFYEGIPCMLCATHDTASAVEGIPMERNAPYISSGTWSLLGLKVSEPITDTRSRKANFTNEGGPGYFRYQKNIMGMWVVNQLKEELCPDRSFTEITQMAEKSTYNEIVDVNAQQFLSPISMKNAFDTALQKKPENIADYFNCAFLSLADSYATAIRELEENTGNTWNDLYIVGGGARNTYLNHLTEIATGKHVIALQIEATALGNLKIQMESKII